MAEIEIKRKDDSFVLDVESLDDAKWVLSFLNTRAERERVLAEVKAYFDAQPPAPPLG